MLYPRRPLGCPARQNGLESGFPTESNYPPPRSSVDENGNPASQAFDFFLYDADGSSQLDWDASDSQWQKAIAIGKGLGLVSGGDFHSLKDYPHFEMPNWQGDEPVTHNID